MCLELLQQRGLRGPPGQCLCARADPSPRSKQKRLSPENGAKTHSPLILTLEEGSPTRHRSPGSPADLGPPGERRKEVHVLQPRQSPGAVSPSVDLAAC